MSPLFWEATRPPTTAISAAIAPPITTTSGCADDGDDGEAARSASGTLVGKAPGGRAMSGAGITNARAMPGRKRCTERYLARAQPGRGPASPSAPRPLRLPAVESQRQVADTHTHTHTHTPAPAHDSVLAVSPERATGECGPDEGELMDEADARAPLPDAR